MKTKIIPALFILLLITSCKKDKHYQVTGRLLLSRSQPIPAPQYELKVYQSGSPGIPAPIGTTSSHAEGITDMYGRFSFRFTQGKGMFMGIPTGNGSPATLSGDGNTGLPQLYMLNFPYKDAAELGDIYLYKKVDAVYIVLKVVNDILPTDSFTVYGSDINGPFKKMIKGISAPANTTETLDTILQASFSRFDFNNRKYVNDISIYKNRNLMPLFKTGNLSDSLNVEDESQLTFTYHVY